ncbi:helix-turn-helix domain-containing protein [Peterkaempfera griseoplana]|uniref:helix-turn-helix domain-containing protein n=1 Tax=Peterkaempfera griseoplana TaxID=66896 RepID=UPI0006E38BB8|nr:helix-turn-helix domain-containing protein [Peterkaempfera griseoplana]
MADPIQPDDSTLRHYTATEVAAIFGCSPRWTLEQAHAKRIAHTIVAGRIRFRADHILAISKANDVDHRLA